MLDMRLGAQRTGRRKWRKRSTPVGARGRVGREYPSADVAALAAELEALNIEAWTLDVDLVAAKVRRELGDVDFDKWRHFLTAKLPTSILVAGVAPQYEDGPIGWADYFRLNHGSMLALRMWTDRIRRESKEYQSSLAGWYGRAKKAGIKTTRDTPRKPSVEEMPGKIEPVDPIKAARKAAGQSEGGLASLLGVTRTQLRIGVAGVATLATLAALAPYARLLGGRRR